MRCPIETPDHVERLVAYSAGRLDPVGARRVEAHLRECAACREFVAEQQAVWNDLDGWEAPPVSADFDARLHRRIRERVGWWDYLVRPLRPLLVRQGVPIAAGATLLVVAGLLSHQPPDSPHPPLPQVSQVDIGSSPDQVDRALDDMEMLRELNRLVRTDAPEPRI